MEYLDYLKTKHWKAIKDQVRIKWRCTICGSGENLDTHHLLYRHLVDCDPGDLRKMCRVCHWVAHRLLREGKIKPKDPNNPRSIFIATKRAVKEYRFGDSLMTKAEIRERFPIL